MFLPVRALSSWVPQLKFLPLSNFYPDPGCAGFVPIEKKTCRQKAVPSAKSEAALMGKFGVKGNRLLRFIFSSRSDVFPFPGVGYSEHTHTWSICPQVYIDLNRYCTNNLQTKKNPAAIIPFFLFNLQFSLYISLYLSDQFWFFFSVTASSASTFYSCKWMITLPSHLGAVARQKQPYCPYTENSALKLFLNIFFFFQVSCPFSITVSLDGLLWTLIWSRSGTCMAQFRFDEKQQKNFLWVFSSLQISSGLGKQLSILAN